MFTSPIQPFAGSIIGSLRQPVEIFIASVDNQLTTKNITDDTDAFNEAKGFLALDIGYVGKRCRRFEFRKCSTWEDLKKFLRATYGADECEDLVRDMRAFYKIRKGQSSMVDYSLRLFDAATDLVGKSRGSDW